MSKNVYIGVGGVARKVKNIYIGVGGVARKVKKGYIGVGGVARLFYSAEPVSYYKYIVGKTRKVYYGTVSIGNYAIFAGGTTNGAIAAINNVAEVWNSSLTSSTTGFGSSYGKMDCSTATIGNYALIYGGTNKNDVEEGTTQVINSNLTVGSELNANRVKDSGGASNSSYAIFVGGQCYSSYDDNYLTVQARDHFNSSLTRTTNSNSINKKYGVTGASIGDYALFAGGATTTDSYSTVYSDVVFTLNSSLTQQTITPLTVSGSFLPAAKAGNYLIIGRREGASAGSEVYNQSLTKMNNIDNIVATSAASTTFNNCAVFGGGYYSGYKDDVILFDESLTKKVLPSLYSTKGGHGAAVTGNYLLFGPGYESNGSVTNVVDVYSM